MRTSTAAPLRRLCGHRLSTVLLLRASLSFYAASLLSACQCPHDPTELEFLVGHPGSHMYLYWGDRTNYPDPDQLLVRLYDPGGSNLDSIVEIRSPSGDVAELESGVRLDQRDISNRDCSYDEAFYRFRGAPRGNYLVILREERLPPGLSVPHEPAPSDWDDFEGGRALIATIMVGRPPDDAGPSDAEVPLDAGLDDSGP